MHRQGRMGSALPASLNRPVELLISRSTLFLNRSIGGWVKRSWQISTLIGPAKRRPQRAKDLSRLRRSKSREVSPLRTQCDCRHVNPLSLFLQPQSSISGLDGAHLFSTAQMPQFTVEGSCRVSIQQLKCPAEFRQIPEKRADNSLCKGSPARTLSHAALTLSNAYRSVAVSPVDSLELARLRVPAFID